MMVDALGGGKAAFEQLLAIAAGNPDNSLWAGAAVSAGRNLATVALLEGDLPTAGDYLDRVMPLARANLETAPEDHITARHYYELAVLQQLAGGDTAQAALEQLAAHPRQHQAHWHLAALLARLAGHHDAADELDEQVEEAGFSSPEYRALRTLALQR